MNAGTLDLVVDKFTFRFPADLFYSEAGVWVAFEGHRARLGLSDFTQQRNGDVAFAEPKAVGEVVAAGERWVKTTAETRAEPAMSSATHCASGREGDAISNTS